LTLASFLRSLGRSIRLAGMFAVAGTELLVKHPATREARAEWLHRFAARAIRGLRIEIQVVGSFPERGAVISNHLSYLDIPVFAALHRCVFVSKAELQAVPVLGWMTKMAGTVYVERGRGGSAARARSGMRAAAEAGLPVVFFPEGTTTNGSELLRFHSGLLAQALEERQPVMAAYVQYSLGPGNESGITVANDVCYWGDAQMLPHIFRLLGLRGLRAQVRFADRPIAFSSDVMHRKQAAIEARADVAALKNEAESGQIAGELFCGADLGNESGD
jgi:1-acyl-sn-glycerol-3-phosphate acyltransferase